MGTYIGLHNNPERRKFAPIARKKREEGRAGIGFK